MANQRGNSETLAYILGQLQASLDRIGDACLALDNQLKCVFANESAATLLDKSKEDMMFNGTDISTLPFFEAEVLAVYKKALSTQQEQFLEVPSKSSAAWYAHRVYPDPQGISIFIETLSSYNNTTKAREEATENMQRLMNDLPNGMLLADMESRQFVFANRAICDMFGYSAAEFEKLSPVQLHPDYETQRVVDTFTSMVEGKTSHTSDLDALRKDGSIFTVDISSVIVSYKGRPCISGLFQDVTQRKQIAELEAKAKESIAASELLMRQAQDIGNMGSWEIWHEDYHIKWSETTYRIYELDSSTFVPTHQSFTAHIHPDDISLVDAAFSKHIEYRSEFNIVFRIITGKKNIKYVHEKCRTEYDASGRPMRTIGMVMDITKQKLAEIALKEEQQNYQALIQHAPVGMVAISEDEHVFLGNKKFQQLTGYKTYDIDSLNEWWEKAYPTEDSKIKAQKNWEFILANNGKRKSPIPNFESIIVCKDGSQKHVEIGYVFTGKYHLLTFVDITQRKIAEENLASNEAKFRRIAEQMTDMVWIGDLQYKASYVSPSVEKIYGITVEEYFTYPLEKRFPQHSIDTFKSTHQKLLAELAENPAQQSREITIELEAFKKDGTPIWVRSTTKVLCDENNKPIGIMGVSSDITARKKAEIALAKSEARYRTLYDASPVGIVVTGHENEILLGNSSFKSMTGYDYQDVADPVAWWEKAYPDASYREKISVEWTNAINHAKATQTSIAAFEAYITCKNGEARYFQLGFMPGSEVNIITFTDVHELRVAQQAVARASANMHNLMGGLPQGVGIVNNNTHLFEYVNPSMCQLFGYTPEEFYSLSPQDLHPDYERQRVKDDFSQMETGVVQPTLMYDVLHKSGKILQVEITPIFVEYNGQTTIAGVFSDVTEKMLANKALQLAKDKAEENELLLKQAQRIARMGSWTLDYVQNQLQWSDAIFEILELIPDAVVPTYNFYLSFVHPDDRELLDNAYQNHLQHRTPYDIRHRIVLQNGKIKYINATAVTDFDETGSTPLYTIGIMTDITNQVVAEQAIVQAKEEAEARELILKQVQKIALTGYWEHNHVTGLITWSPDIFEIFGLDSNHEAPDYKGFFESLPPDDAERVHIAYQQHLHESTPFDLTHHVISKNGSIKLVHQRCQTFYDDNGQPTKSLGVVADITAEEQATTEIKAQAQYINSLLQAIPDLLFVLDQDGRFTAFKSSNESQLLMPPDMFMGKLYHDVMPPALSASLDPIFKQVTEEKTVLDWQYQLELGEGNMRYFDAKLQLMENGSVLILSRDVTEARQAALLLEDSEQKYKSVFEATPVGLVAISATGDILLSNQHFRTLTGYTKEDVPNIETWWTLAYPDEAYRLAIQNKWNEAVMQAIQTQTNIEPMEVSIVCKNGAARYFEIGFVVAGEISLVAFNDVHDKRVAQSQLAESENRFRQIAENVAEVFWLRNADNTKLLYINPAYEKVFGRTVASLYEHPESFLESIHPADKEMVLHAFEEYFIHWKFDIEYRIIWPTGEVRWIHNTSLPVRDPQGNIIGHTGTAEDRTERKKALLLLKEQEEFQRLLMLLATEFINAPVEQFDEVMNRMLEKVGHATKADRAYVFEHDYSNSTSSNTYEWCAESISPEIGNLQELPLHLYSDLLAAHDQGEVYHVPNIEALKETPELYKHFADQNIQSLVVLPLMVHQQNIGFIGFDAVKNLRSFKASEIQLLQVLAEIVTNAIVRRKSETQIRNSENDYRRLFDTMAQGVVYQDKNGHIIKANKAAEKILGLTIDQMLGRSSADSRWHAIHEDGSGFPGSEHPAMETLRTGKPVHNKVMGIFHPDLETYKWIIISSEPEFIHTDDIPDRVFATFTDITDRKAAEAEIHAQSELQRMLMEIATTYINIPLDQLDQSIHHSLGTIGRFVQADRAYIFDYNLDALTCSNTYEWCENGISAEIMNLQNISVEYMHDWLEMHKKGLPFVIADVQSLSNETHGELKEVLTAQHIQSLITLPLIDDNKLLGFIGFDSVRKTHRYTEKEQQLLHLYTQVLLNVKKRLHTENSLEENKRFLENIIDNSGSLIYVKNVDGTYRTLNKRFEQLIGQKREATIGKTDVDIFGEEQAAVYRQHDQYVLQSDKILEIEEIVETHGKAHHFISIKFPLKDNEGRITGVCGMSTEITERKLAEMQLRKNEDRLVQLTKLTNTFAWEVNEDGLYTYVSDVVTAVLGYTPEELVGKKYYYDLHPEENRPTFIALTQHVFRNKETFNGLENKAIHKDGHEVWLATTGTPILDANGHLIGYRGGDTDITHRKQMELALVKSESVYRLLAENSTDVIWILDIESLSLTYVSPGSFELRGYTAAESLIQPVEETMTPESYQEIVVKIQEALATYQSTGILPPSAMLEIEQYHKNGSRVWVEVVAKLQINMDGQLEVLGVSRNITARKKVEQEKLLAQEALKESESRLEAIIETTSDNIWSINNNYEILYINGMFREAFKQSFGFTLNKGDNILQVLPEPFNASWKTHYDYVLQNKQRNSFEERYDFAEGSMWVEVAMFPILANDEITGVSCFGKDITIQKVSELALAESEQRFRTMFRDNASVMMLIDPETCSIIDINPAAAHFYGWPEDKFTQMNLSDISLHPEKSKAKIEAALQQKQLRYEMVHRLSNGTVCEMEVFSSLISVNGKAIIHEIIHDISAKKRAEADLLEKNKQLNLLIQNIPGVVFNCINNDDNYMNFINDYIKEITGYTAAEINETENIYYRKLIHPEDLPNFDLAVETAYQQKQRYNFSYRLLSKDGSYKWVYEIGEFQSYEGTSKDKRIDGIIFDITNQISNEEQKLNAAYDAAEAERTRISHEIHDGIQQTLVASKLSIASMRKDIDQIGGRTLEKFTNGLQLLDQGIQEARSIAHSLMPKQVNDYGFAVAVEHLIVNLGKKVQVNFQHPGLLLNDGKFGTNLFRITQEAVNNIMKHAQATQIDITLIEAGNRLILTIHDNGIGFEKRQLNSPEKGIGMQIMASRAAAMNANFDVATANGKGTTIIVDVPYE